MGTNGIDPRDMLAAKRVCPDRPTKKAYTLLADAEGAAARSSEQYGTTVVPYVCATCGRYHLTSKREGSDVAHIGPNGEVRTEAMDARDEAKPVAALVQRAVLPGPIVPANPDARRKVLAEFLTGKDGVTTDEILSLLSCSRHSVSKYMSEAGWHSERGPGAKWRPKARLVILPDAQDAELEASISRHPSSSTRRDDSWLVTKFPANVSVQDYLQALTLAGLTVEVRVRRSS
jgi:hypothetical protein